MKFGVVNKSTTVNRFVLHTLQRNITHLAVITRKSNIKLGILKKGRKLEKSQTFYRRLWVPDILTLRGSARQKNTILLPKFLKKCLKA